MRTISRSKSTVVVRVSWAIAAITSALAPQLSRRSNIEGPGERADLIVAAELRPRAVAAGRPHQALERDFGAAADLLEIGAGRDEEYGWSAVVVGLGEDVE